MLNSMIRIITILIILPLLNSCGSSNFFGGKDIDKDRIKGDRISILKLRKNLVSDPQTLQSNIALPQEKTNSDWLYPGGSLNNTLENLSGPTSLNRKWNMKIGAGSTKMAYLISMPIIADNKVFSLSSDSRIQAFDINKRKRIWNNNLAIKKENKREGFGGGLSFSDGVVYASTGFGYLYAFLADSGEMLWELNMRIPSRSSPIVFQDLVFVMTHDNQLFAVDKDSGEVMWTHRGILESATILSSTSVAAGDGLIFVPYSSGEIYAIRPLNGSVIWSDSLSRTGSSTSLSEINSITARPIIDDGQLFSVSHAGRMVSIDISTGERVWTIDMSSTETPWLAGDWLFVLTSNAELVCISKRSGKIRWVTQLEQYRNEEKKKNPIQWSGPVMVSSKLLAISSEGKAIWVSPDDGEILNSDKITGSSYLPPLVVNNTVYILNDNGDLSAYN